MSKFFYYDKIVGLVIIEKLMMVLEENKVVFKVVNDVIKLEIKVVVEVLFGVKVIVVNILVCKGKVKCFCGCLGCQFDFKKVVVMLQEGYVIDVIIGF